MYNKAINNRPQKSPKIGAGYCGVKFHNILFLALTFLANLCNAQESPFYVGLGYGVIDYEGKDVDDLVLSPNQKLEDESGFIELYTGYHFNDYISIEIGYANFESMNKKYILNPDVITIVAPNDEERIDLTRTSVNGLLEYPMSQNISVLALLGYSYFDLERELTGGFSPITSKSSIKGGYYGLGIKYLLSDRYSTRLQWVKEGSSGINIDGYRLSLEVAF